MLNTSTLSIFRQPASPSDYKGQLPIAEEYDQLPHSGSSLNATIDVDPGRRQTQRRPQLRPGPPDQSSLQWFARTGLGKVIRHQFLKGVAITVPMTGIILGNDLLGYDRLIIAIVGSVVWGISTALSISVRPPGRRAMDALAESIGYGVAGVVIYPAEFMADCMGYGENLQPDLDGYTAIGDGR